MKIFLGYPSERENVAWEVYRQLKDLGHEVWFDKISLVGADDWDATRAAAQRDAEFVVHLLSREIQVRAGVVNREINTTFRLVDDQPIEANYVLCIRLEDFRLPAALLRFQYIDHFASTWPDSLLKAVEKRRAQLAGDPPIDPPRPIGETVEKHSEADPAIVSFSFSDPLYGLEGKYLRYSGTGLYWSLVNSKLQSVALESYFDSYSDFFENAPEVADFIRENERPYDWYFFMDEFYRKGEVVSVRCFTSINMGGAHPTHFITTYNFLGERFGLVSMQDLLANDEESAGRIVTYCRKVLEAMFPDDINEDSFVPYLHSAADRWSLIGEYGLDAKGLTINISPY